jgi:hypothetical protein
MGDQSLLVKIGEVPKEHTFRTTLPIKGEALYILTYKMSRGYSEKGAKKTVSTRWCL